MAVTYVSDKNPDGISIGQDATDKVAFFGGTPVVQQTASVSTTIVVTNSSATSLLASAIQECQTAANALRTALNNLGATA